MMTEGMKTTEFWLAVVVMVCATVLAFAGHISDAQWMQVMSIVVGAYAVGRGLAKRGNAPGP